MSEYGNLRAIEIPVPLRKQVVVRLREAITEGHLKPGERLKERQLCDLLGVSRTALREGLVELESEGLIENVPNRGPVVASISPAVAEEIYQLRGALEGLAAMIFAQRATVEQISDLDNAATALKRVYDNFSPGEFLKVKGRFYDILLEGAGNKLAAQVLRGIHARASQLRVLSVSQPGRAKTSMDEIRHIVDAIKERNGEAAWKASIDHNRKAAAAALSILNAPEVSSPQVRQRT